MAAETGLSQSSVSRIWRAFGLRPRVVEIWKLSTDPEFIGRVHDNVGLYISPPENALVLCVGEKPQIQALDQTAPCLPMLPTAPARMTHGYVGNCTTSLFAALDPGRRLGHRPALPAALPPEVPVVPPVDRRRRPERPGTPPGPGRLRHAQDPGDRPVAAEAPAVPPALQADPLQVDEPGPWFGCLTHQKISRGVHKSVQSLEADIRDWIEQ